VRALLAIGYEVHAHNIRLAEAEAQVVSRLAGGVSWTGPATKLERLFDQAPRLDRLHIAAHAELDRMNPMATALVIGPGEVLTGDAILERMRLTNTQVTLSTCTSGLSRILPGDELFGIPRALLYAGASSVVCTLWETADYVSLLVMERFYQATERGTTAATALRDAQVALRSMTVTDLAGTLARLSHVIPEVARLSSAGASDPRARPFEDPFHWAPFVLVGGAG
jgi:CHAT domain-containing protein